MSFKNQDNNVRALKGYCVVKTPSYLHIIYT